MRDMQFRSKGAGPASRRRAARAWIAAAGVAGALLAAASAQAATFTLAGDFSNAANPNGPWSFTQGSGALAHFAQPGDGNSLNPAAGNGFYGTGPTFSSAPFVIQVTQDGGDTAPYGDGDFLAGDVIAHSTNPGAGDPLFINWTAPSAGVLSFTSALWYGHSPVDRSNDISVLLDGALLGGVTVDDGVTRSGAITSLSGTNLAVAAGDVLAFRITPTAGQTFGSITGIAATVDFTASAAAIPEPSTWAMMILGFGFAGAAVRRRQRLAAGA